MTNATTTTNTTKEVIATVTRNLEHDGLEITFSDCPNARTRTALKSNGFRWHNVKHIWYAKATGKHIEFCKKQKWIVPESEKEEEPEVKENAVELTDLEKALAKIAELESEIATLKAPKAAKITRTEKTDSAILKRIATTHKDAKYGKAHKQLNGTYLFTNGYIALSDKTNHGLAEAEAHECFKLMSIFDNIHEAEMIVDVTALTEWCKNHSKKNAEPYILNHGNDAIGVNPWYLKDCLTWCDTDIIRVGKANEPVYVIGKERKAICLPIKTR